MLVTSTAKRQCTVWNLANSFFLCTFSLFVTCSESGLSLRQPYLFPHPVWELERSREASHEPMVVNKGPEGMLSLTSPLVICACDVAVNHWVSLGHAQLQATSSPWKRATGYTCFGLWLQFLILFWRAWCSFLGSPLITCLPHSWPWSGCTLWGKAASCVASRSCSEASKFSSLVLHYCCFWTPYLLLHWVCGDLEEENVSTAALLPFAFPLSCDKFTLACTAK